jgi:PIN domain nuclease of toxin-antitoxin system
VKLLLDTHIWLWALLEPERLSAPVRDALQSPENELWLSPISVWEAILLAERGRLVVTSDVQLWVRGLLAALPRREAPLTFEVALMSRRLELAHEDPADRFIAASACVHDLTLVTADARLLDAVGYAVLANR